MLDLRKYRLRSGESLRDEQEVEIAPIELGGQRYLVVPENVPAELTVTRASTGTVYELRFHVRLHGPCFRCLGDAVLDDDLSLREYQAESPGGAEELTTPYVRTTGSTSRRGRATGSCWRCRTRSSAAPIAPASAPSAAST